MSSLHLTLLLALAVSTPSLALADSSYDYDHQDTNHFNLTDVLDEDGNVNVSMTMSMTILTDKIIAATEQIKAINLDDIILGAENVLKTKVKEAKKILEDKITQVTGLSQEEKKEMLTRVAQVTGLGPYFEDAADLLGLWTQVAPTARSGKALWDARTATLLETPWQQDKSRRGVREFKEKISKFKAMLSSALQSGLDLVVKVAQVVVNVVLAPFRAIGYVIGAVIGYLVKVAAAPVVGLVAGFFLALGLAAPLLALG